jgi:8-oxo-dGTP pyrophosphatase MutT (NUDIX family)
MQRVASTVPVRPAASLLLISPSPTASEEYKILLVQRARRGFFGGLTAFPGGAVETSDGDFKWLSILEKGGLNKEVLKNRTSTVDLAFYIAAIREVHSLVSSNNLDV